jgi:rhodanese-related sulfurtransferase
MKKTTKLTMLLLLIFAVPVAFGAGDEKAKKPEAPAAEQYKPKSAQVKRADLDALLLKPEQLLIIDLRRPDEVSATGGFPAYLSIQADQLEHSFAFIPKDRILVTVSNHSGRSGKAADVLAAKGFKVAGYLGAKYYEEEGGKLTKIVAPDPKPAGAAK